MSTETAQPDTIPAVEAMTLEAVQAELAAYQPATVAAVERSEAHLARRQDLWARLDALLGVRKPAIARPVAG
jgi:hypothetical protein